HAVSAAVLYSLSLHDALPISARVFLDRFVATRRFEIALEHAAHAPSAHPKQGPCARIVLVADDHASVVLELCRGEHLGQTLLRRSEEHTSELQSRENLVCRLL